MVGSYSQCFLKTKSGLYLKVRKFKDRLELVAEEIQNEKQNAPSVYKWEQMTWMAFHFPHGEKWYFLKVDGETLKLEDANGRTAKDLNEDYWFQGVDLGSGEHHGLRTKGSNQYLCIQSSDVKLTREKQNSVLVTIRIE